jgi:hypothetical protein
MHERQRLSPVGQKFTFLRQRAPKLWGADAPIVEKHDIGRRAVWKPGDWQKSSRQKDVEQAFAPEIRWASQRIRPRDKRTSLSGICFDTV